MKGQMTLSEQHQRPGFQLTLPLSSAHELNWRQEVPSLEPLTPRPSQPSRQIISGPELSGHVLLAEDNPVNQALIQRVLRKFGLRVTTVEQGDQAVATALQDTEIDLVLMDVNMPVMDGLEATRRLRAQGYAKPVYALTAEHGPQEVAASFAAGCDGHLLKPLELKKLREVLDRHLQLSDHDQAAANLRRLPPLA
jgi:CheY-like chemotaxis protein